MKKRLLSIVAMATLTTTIWADISTKQLNTYMKASGADVVLEKMQKQLANGIEMKAKMRGQEIPADVLKEITAIASNKNNLELFTKGIKALDEKDYKEIIKFYDTKLGKKNANLTRSINSFTLQQEIAKFSTNELSKERKSLISQLVEANMAEKKAEKIVKVVIQSALDAMPKEIRSKFEEQMNAQMVQMKPQIKEQAKKATAYIYRDYSDTELKSLISHFKTSSAQKESEAVIDGLAEYMKAVMYQMTEVMKKKHNESTKH